MSARATSRLAFRLSVTILQTRSCSSKYFTKQILSHQAKFPQLWHRFFVSLLHMSDGTSAVSGALSEESVLAMILHVVNKVIEAPICSFWSTRVRGT